jgi:hypothetical protein
MSGTSDHLTLTKLGNEVKLTDPIAGVTTPYIYAALSSPSVTAFHTEDGGLPSVNVNLRGGVKLWAIASSSGAPELLEELRGK